MTKKRIRSRKTRKLVWYPEVARLVVEGLEHVRDTRPAKVTQAAAAEECELPTGVFSEIRNGRHVLHTAGDWLKFVKAFTHFVYAGKDEGGKRRDLHESLLKAATISKPWPDTLREQLAAGATLNFTSIDYEPFAGSSDGEEECFFESVFSRFFGVGGIKAHKLDNRQGYQPQEYEGSDVTLALFDSADRMLHLGMKFWRIPIRISLGAVLLKEHHAEAHSVAKVLANLGACPSIPQLRGFKGNRNGT